ncbi:hypothetical protein AAGG74_15675 [Bacillus mexicanus]|uniref:hypothetical protein n=1 Tax=Bacillus mexicanus TaxID=2834415 RepID=UPI003D24D72A
MRNKDATMFASSSDYNFVEFRNETQRNTTSNPENNRGNEIKKFCNELRRHNINCSTLKLIPKSQKIKENLLEIAKFVAVIPIFIEDKLFPIETLKRQFRVSKRYLLKHRSYIIAVAILLNGPYKELKTYFLEAIQ